MFNNIIYLIIVLMVFNMGPPETRVEGGPGWAVLMHVMAWAAFALYCRSVFESFFRDTRSRPGRGGPAARYQGLIMRLSVMAVFLFALDVYFFHLRYLLHLIPGAGDFSVIPGTVAVGVFFFYLGTVWYFAYPAYVWIYGGRIGRRSFISGNLRLNVPILFPWAGLTLIYDLVIFGDWGLPGRLLESTEGHMVFFALFLIVLMILMPRVVQAWWGCRPLPTTDKVRELESFLQSLGFRYRALLSWPLFGGHMLTAGIMGLIPRYRYIMVAEGLMDILSTEELKAVLAHEVGHAKYRHLMFYVLFLLGYMALSFGLFDLLLYALASQTFLWTPWRGAGQALPKSPL
ncbi:MAG: M48 family metallopeptidase [Desulfobacteraceae bacterium]